MVSITLPCIIVNIIIVGIVIKNVAAATAPALPIEAVAGPPDMVCKAKGRVFIVWLLVYINGEK